MALADGLVGGKLEGGVKDDSLVLGRWARPQEGHTHREDARKRGRVKQTFNKW